MLLAMYSYYVFYIGETRDKLSYIYGGRQYFRENIIELFGADWFVKSSRMVNWPL